MGNKNSSEILYDVVVIGGGPAGLTACLYASRAGLKTLLVHSQSLPSQAVLTEKIENYPGFPEGISGFELIEKFKKQSAIFGTEFMAAEVLSIQKGEKREIDIWQLNVGGNRKVKTEKCNCLSVIIASGGRPRKLGINGEDKFTGKGVSYCATCDAPFFKDKDVVVIGGGDTAAEEALFLSKFVKKISLIHRRDRLRATKILQERILANKKIELIFDSQVIEITGTDKIEAVRVKNIKTQKESTLSCQGIFIFAGLLPNTDFLKGLVNLDEKGYIITDADMKTQLKGIFACGDCRKRLLSQVITACGEGATAAFSCRQYVEDLKGIAYK